MNDDDTLSTPPSPPRRRRTWLRVLVGLVVLFGLIQLVPYGRAHDNPKVVTEPAWTSAEVQDLATRACADCHSNDTTWPWYSNVAPVSWLVQRDVDEGRGRFNWSEGCSTDELGEVIRDGEMPPIQYTLIHRDAKLSDSEQRTLADGLAKSIADASGTWHECEGGD